MINYILTSLGSQILNLVYIYIEIYIENRRLSNINLTKTGGELRWFGRVSSSCFVSDTRRVTVKRHELHMIYNRYSYERLLVLLFMIIVVALTVFIETLFVGKVDVVLKHPSGIYNSLFILKRQYILILWLFFLSAMLLSICFLFCFYVLNL